ncbi:MAG: TOBE domain-containing protein, partial [Nocardioidaceae bacterium]
VMRAGRLEQIAGPEALYTSPSTEFVAEFVGLTNRLAAVVAGGRAQVSGTSLPMLEGSLQEGAGTALVRPESVSITPDPAGTSTVVTSSFLGAISRVQVTTESGVTLVAQVPRTSVPGLVPGDRVAVTIDPAPVLVVAD